MHATQPASDKDIDAVAVGDPHGCGDGCGSVHFAGGDDGQITQGGLDDIVAAGKVDDLFRIETGNGLAGDNAACAGFCASSRMICSRRRAV